MLNSKVPRLFLLREIIQFDISVLLHTWYPHKIHIVLGTVAEHFAFMCQVGKLLLGVPSWLPYI